MDIPIVLLYLSILLTFGLLVFMLRMKNKKALHYAALGLVLVVFLWGAVALVNQYATSYYYYHGMVFTNLLFSVSGFLPITLFIFGFNYAYQESKWRSKFCWLLLIPILEAVLIWTNDYHHLMFIKYSDANSSYIISPLLLVFPYIAYVLDVLGLFFLIRYSVKNSGFFSRQSMLILIGIIFPLVVDLLLFFNIFPFPHFYEQVSFSIAIICTMFSIFRFGLFSIAPIALQTVVDHITDAFLVVNEDDEIIDFNRSCVELFQGVVSMKRKVRLGEFLELLNDISETQCIDFMKSIKNTRETRKSVSFEDKFLSNNIDKILIVDITPVFTKNQYKGLVILLKDITEQRKSSEMAQKTQLMLIESEHLASLGQLVGGIAHNLKTPIMSISGGLEGLSDLIDEYEDALGDSDVTEDDHREIAGEMRGWIRKMKQYAAYMSDIITAVKGQAVQLTATTTDEFTLQELIKRVEILMNHELKRFSCRMQVGCALSRDVLVKGEINSFIQVINNLIINAIDAYEGKKASLSSISREMKKTNG